MTNFRIQTSQENGVTAFITEAFNAATIALVGVLGIVTLAATIYLVQGAPTAGRPWR